MLYNNNNNNDSRVADPGILSIMRTLQSNPVEPSLTEQGTGGNESSLRQVKDFRCSRRGTNNSLCFRLALLNSLGLTDNADNETVSPQ